MATIIAEVGEVVDDIDGRGQEGEGKEGEQHGGDRIEMQHLVMSTMGTAIRIFLAHWWTRMDFSAASGLT